MHHKRSEGPFRAALSHQFWVLGNQSTCNLKRSVLFLQQQDSRCKAVNKETCLSHVSGISDYVNGVIPTISDFIQEPPFGYIHISQCARSDHISQRQDSKVWWEEEETQVDNGSPVKQSEL